MTTDIQRKIDGGSKTVKSLLGGMKYTIDFYQREYKWEEKQITELLNDLTGKFLDDYDSSHERYEVERYGHYFLGAIVVCRKQNQSFVIDGQQRLTSLTLLLIFLHRQLVEQGLEEPAQLRELIFSEKYGRRSFNLDIEERMPVMDALYRGESFDPTDKPESVRNIWERYKDIVGVFPKELTERPLAYFVDWLLENVHLVEITAYSDEDAYTIFETMNDRGLSLSPIDMLKGYLLANIADESQNRACNALWKQQVLKLVALGKEEDADFFKAWLRSKYAQTIREGKKGAENRDFEKIGKEFHRWIRDHKDEVGLVGSDSFTQFIQRDFAFYSNQYVRLREASVSLRPGLEVVFYNAHNAFTLQYPLILAALKPTDDPDTVLRKTRMVATYIDIFIARRAVNYRTLAYSAIVYTMFNVMKTIRDCDLPELAERLNGLLAEMQEGFDGMRTFGLNQWSRRYVFHLLARMTRHIEEHCGVESSFASYVDRNIKKPFEIEHIWADKYAPHKDEFANEQEFKDYRNRIGGLLLLPRGFNQSFGGDDYKKKLPHYNAQNMLARTLGQPCYEKNPSFASYLQSSKLPFGAHNEFKKADLDTRQRLYRELCEDIWNPARINAELLAAGGADVTIVSP